ncbi:hypothetical protein OPT61_g1159 [Boeremia exigua]|uniref:Uncharacterized protein n=1 Tax=Boeremia exigua TaxID=749465 RepID=A0ACC2IR72_9PLEO|nr:hypothetical protein OPT61_g1159 [Boeremia exigua]
MAPFFSKSAPYTLTTPRIPPRTTMSIDQGFAIRRNGSCISGIEVGCGGTANGMVGCCPSEYQCPQAYNLDCCPVGKNCTMEIIEAPRCSNSSWDLYDNGGYFCCEHGLPAYNNRSTNVCGTPASIRGLVALDLIQSGETAIPSSSIAPSTSSTSVASASDPASATTAPTQSSSTSSPQQAESSTPVGAIAGGVVGGVAGLAIIALIAWLLMRRKRRENTQNPYSTVPKAEVSGDDSFQVPHQLEDTQRAHEAGAGKVAYAHRMELPAQSAPVELPADNHTLR